jgi:hypothetical protein
MRRVIDDTRLANIASAIREKTGKGATYTDEEMPTGVAEVYEAGKKAEYDDFWDAYQNNGNRTDYRYAFAYFGWKKENFKPKYDIRPTGANGEYMFSNGGELSKYDLAKALEEQGVVLDLSGLTTSSREFYMSRFTKLPTLDFSGCTSMANTFDYYIGTSIKLILSESGNTTFSSVFRRGSSLTTVTIESGVIGRSISFSDSPLNVESMKNIISHLKDYSGTDSEFTYKVTFSSACKTALEADGNTSPNGNTWNEYVTDLCWKI